MCRKNPVRSSHVNWEQIEKPVLAEGSANTGILASGGRLTDCVVNVPYAIGGVLGHWVNDGLDIVADVTRLLAKWLDWVCAGR
jgi:hypothetical protein